MSLGDDMLYIAIYIIAATLLLIVEKGYILINKTDYRKIWKDEITIISTVSILIALIMAIYKSTFKKELGLVNSKELILPGYHGTNIVKEKINTIENGSLTDYNNVLDYYYLSKADSTVVYEYAMSEIHGYFKAYQDLSMSVENDSLSKLYYDKYILSYKNILIRDSMANIPLRYLRNKNMAFEMPVETIKSRIAIVETGDKDKYSENNMLFSWALDEKETNRYVIYDWTMFNIYGSNRGKDNYGYFLRNYSEYYSLRMAGVDLIRQLRIINEN